MDKYSVIKSLIRRTIMSKSRLNYEMSAGTVWYAPHVCLPSELHCLRLIDCEVQGFPNLVQSFAWGTYLGSHVCRGFCGYLFRCRLNSALSGFMISSSRILPFYNRQLVQQCSRYVITILIHVPMPSINATPGARLTKAYDVTIQRYRNSHAKIHDSKMHILRCMGSKFCVKFQRCPLKFHTKFEPIHRKICILWGGKNLTTYDIFELWHLKS